MITSTLNGATTGRLLALAFLLAVLASLMLAAGPAHATTTFTVNSTADHADANPADGFCDTGNTVPGVGGEPENECTLRAAINQANYTPGTDTVNFNIPTGVRDPDSGVKTLAPESALPTIAKPLTINGYSQPGAQPNTKTVGSDAVLNIELSGASAPSGVDGLVIGASGSTVRGLVVNRWGSMGIHISGSDATGNRIVGNYLGTDASGTKDMGNSENGIFISGAPNNTIGGTTPGTRNVISGNERNGVVVNFGATGNRVLSNSVFANGGLGIDLKDDGPTANDPGDKDTGANGLQNKPALSSAKKNSTGTTSIKGNLNSTPNKTFQVQFFSNPSGTNEGKTLLGSKSVTTNGTGNVSFTFPTKKAIRLGQNITATATNTSTGNTSEFSGPRKVVVQ